MLRYFRMALIKSLRCLVTFIKRNMAARNEDSILPGVKHVILVLSGKGGVGKSTVATMLAMTLKLSGKKIGILDVDLCGPSIPRMLNVEGNDVHKCPQGWVPVYADKEKTLAVMSIGFLLTSRENAVIWRGPKKNAMIKQFLTDVYWGDIDYLIIDTPPGTSDEHLAVMEALHSFHPDGAVLVTTPQAVAVNDVRREITFCEKTGIPVLGVIENLSGFICPHCKECSNLFSKGGGESLANITKIPFLGCVPIDVKLAQCLEDGHSFIEKYPTSSAAEAFQSIVKILLTTTDK